MLDEDLPWFISYYEYSPKIRVMFNEKSKGTYKLKFSGTLYEQTAFYYVTLTIDGNLGPPVFVKEI